MMPSKVPGLCALAYSMYEWSKIKSCTNDLLQVINILAGRMRAGQGQALGRKGQKRVVSQLTGIQKALSVHERCGGGQGWHAEPRVSQIRSLWKLWERRQNGEQEKTGEMLWMPLWKKKTEGKKRVRLTVKEVFSTSRYMSLLTNRGRLRFKRYD